MAHSAPLPSDYSALDAGLERLADRGIELANGFTNHAPMVIEALCALNRPEAIAPWLDHYLPLILDRPGPVQSIDPQDWTPALGQPERFDDWSVLIGQDLAQCPWPEVVARWTQRLAPGACAAATHGLLRTAHAARGLGQGISPPRVRELADAIASWACTYQTLPVGDGADIRAERPHAAILQVRPWPEASRPPAGSISEGLAQLAQWPAFADDIHRLEVATDPPRLFSDISETCARLYLANGQDPFSHIVFVHAITSTEAARGLSLFQDEEQARQLARFQWQTVCGLYARFGVAPPKTAKGLSADDRPSALKGLIDDAVASGDDHQIKLTEACLRANARKPSPAHLLAARKSLDQFS